jgi:hypothetical protein
LPDEQYFTEVKTWAARSVERRLVSAEKCRIHPLGQQKKIREMSTHPTNNGIYGKIQKKL